MKRTAHTETQAPRKRAQASRSPSATLPTSEQIELARLEVDEILAALLTIRRCLDGLPTSECAESVANATEVMGRFRANTRSSIRGLTRGVTPKKVVRRTAPVLASKEEEQRARELCDLINSLL